MARARLRSGRNPPGESPDEIDKHKNANSRTRDRALEIFRRIRQMLKTWVSESEIRAPSPRVVLRRMPSVKPDIALEEHLDYVL